LSDSGTGLLANASTLRAFSAISSTCFLISSFFCSVREWVSPLMWICVHFSSITSGAPFELTVYPVLDLLTVLIIFLMESKGASQILLFSSSTFFGINPALMAATRMAPSVGSPIRYCPMLGSSIIDESLHRSPVFSISLSSGVSCGWIFSLFWLMNLPVGV